MCCLKVECGVRGMASSEAAEPCAPEMQQECAIQKRFTHILTRKRASRGSFLYHPGSFPEDLSSTGVVVHFTRATMSHHYHSYPKVIFNIHCGRC